MSQPATSPFEGLADLLHCYYSTGFANVQLPRDWKLETGGFSLQSLASGGPVAYAVPVAGDGATNSICSRQAAMPAALSGEGSS